MRNIAWAILLGLTITSPAQALMCEIPIDPVTGNPAQPGAEDYDPVAYGRLLYTYFAGSLDAPGKVVLVGTLTPRWTRDQPLLHEVLAEQERAARDRSFDHDLAEGAFHAERVNIEYSYFEALDFSGGRLLAEGLVPIPDGPLDYVFGSYDELYPDAHPIWSSPRIFVADIDRAYSHRITVHSLSPCDLALPAPDPVALDTLIA